MQIAFDEKYQSQFNVMQAELANQFAVFQTEREKMKRDWYDFTNFKDKEIETLKLRFQEAQKALDKVNRPGSSHDMPVNVASATGTVTKVITETIREENDPKPPNRPGGPGGGGGDGGNPGDPSGSGRARQPTGNDYNKPNPGNPGGPNGPNPPEDPWDTYSSAPEPLRALIGNAKNNKEAGRITLPNLPKADMLSHWKLTVRKVILSASIDPDATCTRLLEIEKANATFDSLYDPGDYFRILGTKLCVAVDNLVKDNNSLQSDIDIETETLAKQGKRIAAGRQVLLMVCKSYKTNVENGTVYDVMDVIAVELHGNHVGHFIHRWDKVILGLSEPMPEITKKAFFVSKVRNCPVFQAEYLDWKRKLDDDPTKTLETLRGAVKDLIEDARREKVREEELRGLSGFHGRRERNLPPAYAADIEDSSVPPTADTPAPNGGGNRRGRSRARGSQRSASPGVRSTASNDTKGKGKCKFDSRKGRALRSTDAHFPTILVSQCMSLRVKVKENAKDLIRLVPPRPRGGVGETPHEDATPPEVVRLLADQAGGDQ